MKLGVCKIDITPRWPVELAGFANHDRKGKTYDEVLRPLYARMFYFRDDHADGTYSQALLVSADLIWWGTDRIGAIREKLLQRWGLKESSVILHATHTHSGPQTSKWFQLLGRVDPEYIEHLEQQMVDGVGLAMANAETVIIERGTSECPGGINRRRIMNGKAEKLPNDEGPNDPEVTVVRFGTESGSTKGLLVHYTCHPSITSANSVSSEFTGVAMDLVEEQIGGGAAVSAFLQGYCGDIRANLVRDGVFCGGNDEDVRAQGNRLADAVLERLRLPMERLKACPLTGKQLLVPIPFARLPTYEELRQEIARPGGKKAWAALLLREPERIQAGQLLEMTRLDLASGLSLLAMNGEMVVEYGLFIKQVSNGTVLPLGYSNGMIGYIPTAGQLSEGGYEPLEAIYYFGLPAPYDGALEENIRKHIVAVLEDI
ncbi:hypothetical protein FE783_13885 [Paenibacillus mesophilus]|uniref:neutral/alkaline non-lysosomal ceramidase N-terminal domain-containing protein n=1 Tax=Paenibacillus mesophilus TaxID=2582849 RepID=UPI00110D6CEB|nr:neutral/alkaline non-lysosomal ceramidase N-terminal domain-containing protein [Paenibacillus mesophilus]TMV49585.1 hypothetical protein FE783_13885 [Paenibacillus mesophilus]